MDDLHPDAAKLKEAEGQAVAGKIGPPDMAELQKQFLAMPAEQKAIYLLKVTTDQTNQILAHMAEGINHQNQVIHELVTRIKDLPAQIEMLIKEAKL